MKWHESDIGHRLERLLEANACWRDPTRELRNLSPWLAPLQRWQSRRLAASFADFIAAPGTRDATTFFLTDLYGDHDVSARDRDVSRVMPMMKRVLPDELLGTAADAIELAVLSHGFDLRVATALESLLPGAVDESRLDAGSYAEAYRRVGLPRLRTRQIDLIVRIGSALDAAVHKPWVARLLRASRLPARVAGLGALQGFLERGFAAFAKMDDAGAFMAEIARREGEVSRRLFAGVAQPFALS
ncbi:hypothetical protein OS176_09910 [Xanthomonadaceae bacterium XH05]|nr:hypothetical protein [Xanthomonadaceae bacterium XH05]